MRSPIRGLPARPRSTVNSTSRIFMGTRENIVLSNDRVSLHYALKSIFVPPAPRPAHRGVDFATGNAGNVFPSSASEKVVIIDGVSLRKIKVRSGGSRGAPRRVFPKLLT